MGRLTRVRASVFLAVDVDAIRPSRGFRSVFEGLDLLAVVFLRVGSAMLSWKLQSCFVREYEDGHLS